MAKRKAKAPDTWRNRIVGHGVVNAANLVANDKNWRQHPKSQEQAMTAALEKIGWVQDVIVNKRTNRIVDGHLRVSMSKAKNEKVPVTYVDLTEAEEQFVLTTFDPLGALAEQNNEALKSLLQQFNDDALAALIFGNNKALTRDGKTDPDEVPEPQKEPITKTGDLWLLGNHRILCGDSTKAEDVARGMGGSKADLCFTSPPYANQRNYCGSVGDWDTLMQGVFAALPMADRAQVLVNLGLVHHECEWWPYWEPWIEWMRAQGWRRFGWYTWDQGPGLPGDWNGRLAPAFEFVFHFNRVAERARKTKAKLAASIQYNDHGNGMRRKDGTMSGVSSPELSLQSHKIPDSVIRVMRHKARGIETEHPAVFPVALAEEIITAFSDDGNILYEPFSGSGSQILAAEKNNLSCYAIEVAPQYVDVSVIRWQNFTGQQAILESTGDPFPIPPQKGV